MRVSPMIPVAAVALLLAGCGTPMNVREGSLQGERFEVRGSSLDWMEIAYTPRDNDPDIDLPCKLSLYGSGEIVFTTGRSPRVWDDFSQKIDDPDWNDVRQDRRHIGDEAMRSVMQDFINAGIAPPTWGRMTTGEAAKPPMVRIRAKINGKSIFRVTDNRKVVRLVERQLVGFR